MISERQEQLIQDVLEGDASASQRAELERLVAADAAVRERWEEMSRVFRLLSDAPAAEFPSALHAELMTALDAEREHGSASPRPRWNFIPVMGAFLAGATAATLVVVSVTRGPQGGISGPAPVSGTMAPAAAEPILLSTAILRSPLGDVSLSTFRRDGEVVLQVRSHASRAALQVTYSADSLAFVGVRADHPGELGPTASRTGYVSLSFDGGGEVTFRSRTSGDASIRVGRPGSDLAVLHTSLQL